MEISSKFKAGHVQIHIFHTKQNVIFHTKQNGIPWCHDYWKWSSQIQSDRLWVQGAQNKLLHNVTGLDCMQFLLSKVRT